MPKIDWITLKCRDPEAQRRFYCDVLGMKEQGDGTVGYGKEEAGLKFEQAATAYCGSSEDLYWKIALSVPDLDLACRQLAEKGVRAGAPEQFGDIGYLAHFKDPEGFPVELIAHCFKGERSPKETEAGKLGGGPALNLLTLRCRETATMFESCDALGMKLLATMPVEAHGFTLYFFAFTEEDPPSSDPLALQNRSWLYQRPYTVLEFQHRPSLEAARLPGAGQAGYRETVVTGLDKTLVVNVFCVRES